MPSPFEVLRPADLRRRTSLKWQHYGPDVLPLWVAEMDVLPPPEAVEALGEAVRSGDTGYPASDRRYAQAFSAFAEQRWSWTPEPSGTVQCADVMTGIRVLLDRLHPGGPVVIPMPVYPPFSMAAREAGRAVVPVALTLAGRLDVPAIERALAAAARDEPAVLLLCSPHNPTGVVHTEEELAAVSRVAQEHRALVIVDEIHGPLVPAGATFVPWLTVAEHGLVVTSAAKAFNLSAIKSGLIVAGPASARLLRQLPESVSYGCSHLGVIGHAAAYRGSPRWLDEVNANIAANRGLLADLLARHLPGVGYRTPQGTYLAWLDLRGLGLGDDPAAELLRRGRVALTAGLPFGHGRGHARLNLACSQEVLREAVDRMATVLAGQPAPGGSGAS